MHPDVTELKKNNSSGSSLNLLLVYSLRTGTSSIFSATCTHTRHFSPSVSFRILPTTGETFVCIPLLKDPHTSYVFPTSHKSMSSLSFRIHIRPSNDDIALGNRSIVNSSNSTSPSLKPQRPDQHLSAHHGFTGERQRSPRTSSRCLHEVVTLNILSFHASFSMEATSSLKKINHQRHLKRAFRDWYYLTSKQSPIVL